MASQPLEKIKSAPGNGMVSEAPNLQDMVHGRAFDEPRCVSVGGISAREAEGNTEVAGKWRRNRLKRLNPRREMVWSRKPRTYKIWFTGARLTVQLPLTSRDAFGRRELRARGRGQRSRREMAPQPLEKIESAPGNGMVSEASDLQDMVHGCAAEEPQEWQSRKSAKLQKKAPNVLKSLDAELKSAPTFRDSNPTANIFGSSARWMTPAQRRPRAQLPYDPWFGPRDFA